MGIGHTFRAQLAGKVDSSIDTLIMRLRHLFTVEHNDDGTHKGIDFSGSLAGKTITIVNGIVTKVE